MFKALRDGLMFAWNRGYRLVLCEIDCQMLKEVLHDEDRVRLHSHATTLLEIKGLLARDWTIKLAWINRETNFSADYLARQGSSAPEPDFRVVENPSPELDLLLMRDKLVVP
ncbi:uncharacterized protein LOC130724749 [Lotus japonicus]|uniref:uncharacterized protein LOC130724749 n=1 Tax=Lotus japonicus TaxID=34305 RepID=UPI00258DA4BD|nr:uncharacterized protein LOC130724749 [Lotus japonicus]